MSVARAAIDLGLHDLQLAELSQIPLSVTDCLPDYPCNPDAHPSPRMLF